MSSQIKHLSTKTLLVLRPLIEQAITRYSRVGNREFFDVNDFAWVARVEASWPAIRAELDQVLRFPDAIPRFQDISVEQLDLTQDDRWKTFFFYLYGARNETNGRRCPETMRALAAIPELTTAFFSILLPGKRIPRHRGPYKGVLRYHLGLIVPEPASSCGIEVGGKTAQWQEGKSLIFDDTFEHEAWNSSAATRVILFVDFRRPLPFPIALLNRIALFFIGGSGFVQGAVKRSKAWDANLEEVYRNTN